MSQLESLREAVRLSPDNLPLLLLFAETCLNELAGDEAVRTYQQVLAREPSHAAARLGLARALHQTGQTSQAVVRLEAFVQEFPDHSEAWLHLSRFLMAEGLRDQAKEHYERSLKIPGARRDTTLEQDLYLGTKTPESKAASPARAGKLPRPPPRTFPRRMPTMSRDLRSRLPKWAAWTR
jgi:transitional endoplasmic reticulum ATPase